MLTYAAPGPTSEGVVLALRKVYVFPRSVVKVRCRLVVCANASIRLHVVWESLAIILSSPCLLSLRYFKKEGCSTNRPTQ